MQTMVHICEQYSVDWKFKFNPQKSIQLYFTNSLRKKDILLYGSCIPVETSAKHVGVLLNTKFNSMDRTLRACRTLRSSAIGLIKSGLHPSEISVDICSRIIRQVCFPKAFFGCELWTEITNTERLLLERAQRFVCKAIQGLPKQTRTDMCNSLLGWKSAEAYVDERKLLFLGQLVTMKDSMLPKRIFLTRAMEIKYNCINSQRGFIPDIHRILTKYELLDFDTYLSSGYFPAYIQWKKKVQFAVQKLEEYLGVTEHYWTMTLDSLNVYIRCQMDITLHGVLVEFTQDLKNTVVSLLTYVH